ncbi:MAG: adenosine deaminase [Pseudomonadales bacterium]
MELLDVPLLATLAQPDGATAMDILDQLPKAELHVHLEGTLEPELALTLAARNGITLPWTDPEALRQAYSFNDLPSFLAVYYAGMTVLQTEQDFYDLAMAYFRKAAEENIVYVEPFFDPQAHTRRGISFDVVIRGFLRAQADARTQLGIESHLIMCFLRDESAASAAEHLELATPWLDQLIGVGLDSDEAGNPPRKFTEVFARARERGLKLTMHCDLNQTDSPLHIRECLDLIGVERIDHGINALDDPSLVPDIVQRKLALTVCPVSNRFVVGNLTAAEIRTLMDQGVCVTINSDDPAYFGAYLTQNLKALRDEAGFEQTRVLRLARNAFEGSWLEPARLSHYLQRFDDYVAAASADSS